MSGWISVKDRPVPRDGNEYLVAYGHQGFVKQLISYNEHYGYWQSKGTPLFGVETNVTHWLYIPEPLK